MTAYFRSTIKRSGLNGHWFANSDLIDIDDLLEKMPDRGISTVLKSAAFPISLHEADRLTMEKYGVSFAEKRQLIREEYCRSFSRDGNAPMNPIRPEREKVGKRIDSDESDEFSVQRGIRGD